MKKISDKVMKKGNRIVMAITAGLLLFATATKVHQLLTEPIVSEGFWESWEFFIIQVILELGLAIWLVCGLFRKAGWLLATIGFFAFSIFTSHKIYIGAASCGCFGEIEVNPWITLFTMDLPIFFSLLIFRPKGEKLLPPPWPGCKHFFAVAIPTFVLLVMIALVLIYNRPAEKTEEYVTIRPEQWAEQEQQQQWEMLQYIDIADSIKNGICVVLFYHYDCPNCREAIPVYDEMAREYFAGQEDFRFAFIEAPPFGDPEKDPVPTDTPCLTGKLDDSVKYFNLTTPLTVLIEDGRFIKHWEVDVADLDDLLGAFGGD